MIARLVAAALLATGLAAVPAATSTAGGPTVSVADMQFTPASLKVGLGATVTWSFSDSVAHTSTSDQGFWNSGPKSSGDTFAHTFASAGSYRYHCTFHPSMTGSVRVPVGRSGSPSTGWTLRWATGASSATYDVEVRKGTGAWKMLRNDTSAVSMSFHRLGTWSVRARTQDGSAPSGWSPLVKVRTT